MHDHEHNRVRYLTFESFDARDHVHAFVTTRHGGESTGPYATLNLGLRSGDDAEVVTRNRARVAAIATDAARPLVFGKQVHGTNVAVVPAGHTGPAFEDTDALVTARRDVPLTILTADCTAIFLFDPVNRAVGLAHAGWRGTVAGIAVSTLERMHTEFGSRPHDVIAAIGPSIGPCCYEVGAEVVDAFVMQQPDIAEEVLADPDFASAGSFRAGVNEGKKMLDLWRANELILMEAGVMEDRIEIARLCTSCRTDLFYSHRAEKGVTGRFAGVISLR